MLTYLVEYTFKDYIEIVVKVNIYEDEEKIILIIHRRTIETLHRGLD